MNDHVHPLFAGILNGMGPKDAFQAGHDAAREAGATETEAENAGYHAAAVAAEQLIDADRRMRLRIEWEKAMELRYDVMPQWWWDRAKRDAAFAEFCERRL